MKDLSKKKKAKINNFRILETNKKAFSNSKSSYSTKMAETLQDQFSIGAISTLAVKLTKTTLNNSKKLTKGLQQSEEHLFFKKQSGILVRRASFGIITYSIPIQNHICIYLCY